MPPKRRKARNGRVKDFDPETVPVGYELGRYPTEVNVSAQSKKTAGYHQLPETRFVILADLRWLFFSALLSIT